MNWEGNATNVVNVIVFMCSIKSHVQLWNSINNINTSLKYSVTIVPFEAGIDRVFILERNNTNPTQLNRNGKYYKSKLWKKAIFLILQK